ncbi:MAG: MarC family protein [Rickettsiales bacterium]
MELLDIEFIKTAFLTLFVAIDPPGLATIFIAITTGLTAAERRATALRASIIAFCILAASVVGGKAVLEALGVGIPAFRIAGGLLLFSIAVEMVFEKRQERKAETAEKAITQDHLKSIAAFPLAIPLMAGPGAITATIVQASSANDNWINMGSLVGIIFIIIASCYVVFLLAQPIERLLGVTGKVVLARLLGVLLAAIAVQVVGEGLVTFIHEAQL